MGKTIVYSDNQVRVCEDLCDTCVFRPGNLMDLRPGRLAAMIRDALKHEGHIVCHSTLDQPLSAICRGYADLPQAQRRSLALRLGAALEILVYVPVSSIYRDTPAAAESRSRQSR